MSAGQHPTASHAIDMQHFGIESLHERLDLGIVQLSHVELSAVGGAGPPEKNVRRRLHQTLPHHDALPLMTVRALPGIRLKDRCHRFFKLEKQRIVAFRHHQGNPAPPTDTADADYLNGDVHEAIPIEKHAPVVRKRSSVGVEKFVEGRCGAGDLRMEDQGRLVSNADLSAYRTRKLWKIIFRAAVRRGFFDPFLDVALHSLGQRLDKVIDTGFCVPHLKWAHFREFMHVFAVPARAAGSAIAALTIRKSVRSGGKHYRCDKSLYIPLPWRRAGLIEIVDVEDDAAFGRGKSTKVKKVTITARLHF